MFVRALISFVETHVVNCLIGDMAPTPCQGITIIHFNDNSSLYFIYKHEIVVSWFHLDARLDACHGENQWAMLTPIRQLPRRCDKLNDKTLRTLTVYRIRFRLAPYQGRHVLFIYWQWPPRMIESMLTLAFEFIEIWWTNQNSFNKKVN